MIKTQTRKEKKKHITEHLHLVICCLSSIHQSVHGLSSVQHVEITACVYHHLRSCHITKHIVTLTDGKYIYK